MTKFHLCDKIINMKKLCSFKNLIYTLLLTACFSFAMFGFSSLQHVSAQTNKQTLFVPSSNAQQFDFTTYSPKDAVAFNGGFALIREDQTLWVYTNADGYVQYDKLVRGNPTLMKPTEDNHLIYSDDTALFVIDLSDLSKDPVEIQFAGSQILCTYFDFNGSHLVTINGTSVMLYTLDGSVATQAVPIENNADTLTPICIDTLNNVYLVKNSNIHYYNLANKVLEPIYGFASKPSVLVAHGKYAYFTEGTQIKRLSPDKQVSTLTPPVDNKFELGNLASPTKISFYGENVLVCDSIIGAVQEFSINGNALEFTGFAIAKNKTAFNRIDVSATEVDRYKNYIAVLSANRVMIINAGSDYDYFSRETYVNLFEEDFNGNMPKGIALGDRQLVTFTSQSVKLYDFSTKTPAFSKDYAVDGTITDVCYQSGYFYLLANYSDSTSKVYKFTASDMLKTDFAVTQHQVSEQVYSATSAHQFNIAVNVFGKIYTQGTTTKKIVSDLVGNFYTLNSDGIYLYNPTTQSTELVKTVDGVNSLTLGFDKQVCYMLKSADEQLLACYDLGNKAIDAITLPADYKTYSDTTDGNLTAYTVDGGNVYVVGTTGDTLSFIDLASAEKHYLYVCSIDELNLNVLVAQKGIVLVDKDALTEHSLNQQQITKTAYVTTGVNGYYFPIITREDGYTLKNLSSLENVRLTKGDTIETISKIEFLDIEYYLATFTVNGTTHKGFVPVNFTTLTPISISNFTEYTYEKSQNADVFADDGLTNKIAQLQKGDLIRVFSNNDKIVKIQYLKDGVWTDGYISAKAIQSPNKAIRNVLIVLATLACVCGSTTYFLIRKKQK